MDYEKSYYILHTGMPGGFLVTMAGLAAGRVYEIPGMLVSVIGLLLMFGSLLQAALYYRCPHCGAHFPIRSAKLPKFCQECGKKLEDRAA